MLITFPAEKMTIANGCVIVTCKHYLGKETTLVYERSHAWPCMVKPAVAELEAELLE